MSSLIFSLEATVPIFLVIILGYILMRTGFFTPEFTRVADKYVFRVALPVLLFKQIATSDIYSEFQLKFVLYCMLATTAVFVLTWIYARFAIKDRDMRGAFVQASSRGSTAILGIAFIENIYGSSGMGPLMLASAVPLYNIYSVIVLTFGSKEHISGKGAIKKALVNVAKNPIIIGILAGLVFAVTGIKIPTVPLKAVTSIAQTATPVALLVVGAGFEGKQALAKIKPTCVATLFKLVLLPVIFLPVAVAMGFRNEALVAIIIMLASPTTVTSYIMAKNMGNDEVLSLSVIVLSTFLSPLTLTGWIFAAKYMAFI